MKYFKQDFLDFFKELEKNNHKDWFHANKKRYENSVKKPFAHFVETMIQAVQEHDEELTLEPKNSISRINRDIRFSADKTPYNTHLNALISRGGKKDKSIPGIFLRFSAEKIWIMGGCYMPSKEQLQSLRHTISNNLSEFRSVIDAPKFKGVFGEICGEANKRIPKEFQEAHAQEPLIANKQFYFMAEREAEFVLSEQLIEGLMHYWHAMRPVNEYLMEGMKG